jgi:hypothetical protein
MSPATGQGAATWMARWQSVPAIDGVITIAELDATADAIAEVQLSSGMIPWFPGGHADPWNHVESAMALLTMGRRAEAERAYQWLCDRQRDDGSWHNYYLSHGIEDPKLDVNCIAYVATGVWHHWLATGDPGFTDSLFPVVDRAIEFVLDLQTRRGEILWARTPEGMPWSYALLTGTSSIGHSLACALELADLVGLERPRWVDARCRLVDTVASCPNAFAPKDRWAMDWYYPVLAGAVTGGAATRRLAAGWDRFVIEGRGVRCVADQPWVTAAETCECAMAYLAAGDEARALQLFAWTQCHRDGDGSYFTGIVYPRAAHFPPAERSTYTGAAVILAADALCQSNPTSDLFTRHR